MTHTFEPSCLVIGGSKSNLEFNPNDLTNLLKVCAYFEDTEVDIYIVFSKLAQFTDVELKLIRDQAPEVRQKIVLLDVAALESEGAFQTTKITILDMEGLARERGAIYLLTLGPRT